jgi:hypothetical protein
MRLPHRHCYVNAYGSQGEAPWKIVGEHILIALVVIGITHVVGDWVSTLLADNRVGIPANVTAWK